MPTTISGRMRDCRSGRTQSRKTLLFMWEDLPCDAKMSVPDTAVSMAATWSYPCTPQGRNWVTPASTAMPTNLRQYNLREINRDQSLRRICSWLPNFAQ